MARILSSHRIVTCDPAHATSADPLGVLDDAALVIDKGLVVAVGPRAEIIERFPALSVERADGVITPGLIDAHTHAPSMGSRDDEYVLRMGGGSYEDIAAAGGGILSSMRAVRAATIDEMATALMARLRRMAALGVTTVEAKSGYGLDESTERKQLEAIDEATNYAFLPRLVPTYLALHALPPEANGDRDAYAATVASKWLPGIAAAGLARFVDAYVERSAFSAAQARIVLARARELGLGVRLHVGQFSDIGGAELAAELGASSVDHLEVVGPEGIAAIAAAGIRAVLLPVASFTMGKDLPPIAALRAAGIPLVVASDANPGTAPTESLPLALAFAVRNYGHTPAEALLGATREAAAALGLADVTGVLRAGLAADLVVWDLPHENAVLQPWGTSRARSVMRAGAAIG